MGSEEQPSHENLYVLNDKKIQENSGILKDEDKLELLCERYVTFLFLLHERVFGKSDLYDIAHDCFQHILYFLKVFDPDPGFTNAFMMEYCQFSHKVF